jgi:hypothetical protein
MLCLKVEPVSRPWESWKGFTCKLLLVGTPSDSFDLAGFVASKGSGLSSRPASRNSSAIKGVADFLPP